MIYNGIWRWPGTCANNRTTNAQLADSPFNSNSNTVAGKSYTGLQQQNMHAIGYTYSNVAAGTTSATALSTLLGATGNDTTTNTNSSTIKQYIEDWYSTNMVNASSSSYTSMLEESAGYCNDRSVYNSGSYAASAVLPDSTTVIPYGTSSMTRYNFGAYTRNLNAAQNPSLTCPRGIVDTYSTTTTSGGNGQLTHPIALLTADELSFAGSGSSTATNGSSYNAKSFLHSGGYLRLLSPSYRIATGYAGGFYLWTSGFLSDNRVDSLYGVRPAISLKPGTIVASGTGIATDPWTINE